MTETVTISLEKYENMKKLVDEKIKEALTNALKEAGFHVVYKNEGIHLENKSINFNKRLQDKL